MRQLLTLMILTISFLSCKTKTETTIASKGFQLLIPDTTNNRQAHLDFDDINYRSKLENQIGLNDLKKGVDSLEIRLWHDISFSNFEELYILKFQDTNSLLSYYRVYPRGINYDNENENREWNPYTDPIIDSLVSKFKIMCETFIWPK